MPHPAYITSVPACEKARLALSSGCLTSAHPYITFTLVPPVPNTCAPPARLHIPHRVPPTAHSLPPHVPVLRISPLRGLDASDSDGRARGRVGREYARARLGHFVGSAVVDVEGPTRGRRLRVVARHGGVWGRRRVDAWKNRL